MDDSPDDYIAAIGKPDRRADMEQLDALIRSVAPTMERKMWGACGGHRMIGYGSYHFKYATGREGEWCAIALASNAQYISLHACCPIGGTTMPAQKHRDALKPANIGKSCVRFKRLGGMDLGAIKAFLKDAAAAV